MINFRQDWYNGPLTMPNGAILLEVNAFTDPDAQCYCVGNHNPNVITFHIHHILPLAHGGENVRENVILLCPTIHYAVHHLLRELIKGEGIAHWDIRKRFGVFARDLADEGYRRIVNNKG